jgi:outer membrane protein assembly factor BamB
MGFLLALVLAAAPANSGNTTQLPPVPAKLWQVAWQKQLVASTILEWKTREVGGPAVDPVSGYVVVGTRDGWLRAFDPDGVQVWSMEAKGRFDASPRIDRDTVYAGSNDGRLYAVEIGSGKIRWTYESGEEFATTPVVAGDLVLAMTLQDTLVAVDAKTGAWKWHHRRDPREGFTIRGAACVSVADGLAVGAYSDGTVAVLDLATGGPRWERKVAPTADFMDVDGLRVASGRIYAAAYSGAVLALDLHTGQQIWEVRTPNPTRLTLTPGMLVVVTATQVMGIGTRDGKTRWAIPLDGESMTDPVLVGQRVAVPTSRWLMWLDPSSGRVLRKFDPGTGVSAPPAWHGRRVYVLSNQGGLIALDLV